MNSNFTNPELVEKLKIAIERKAKNLAYEINGVTDGDYMLVDFHCDPEGVAELNRVLRLTVEVQRHMIVNRTDRD